MHGQIVVILTLVVLSQTQDLSNLGRDISDSVSRSLKPLDGLGSRINSAVRDGLAPLDNLGTEISQSVYEGLEPVRAMEIKNNMKNGIGGVTIVHYQPGGTEFIIRNNRISRCSGSIDPKTGECSGTLTPYHVQNEEDYCFLSSGYSIINDKICVGANFVSVINNEVICKSNSGQPVLFTTLDRFRKTCRNVAATANYRYIADHGDPNHVKIPTDNRFVKCSNNAYGVCDFQERNNFMESGGRSGIFVQNVST